MAEKTQRRPEIICPHNTHVDCITVNIQVMPIAQRKCDRCAWGPNGKLVCDQRIIRMGMRKEQANGKRTRKIQE